ncbi:MAG TPA: tripartite tricarboxylate transporter substrate binding protein [Burkholderiales bacterium]|jgi:tripartite-type tricarboxylate transporter receptor subunit TctC|nr:tripartite tricarboxylate transporter substrate binding protein [Burkholderiales bacterium]
MRSIIGQCAMAAAFFLAAHAAGQNYPTKPIRLIVPFAAGGGVDFTARVVAQKLGEAYGQPVVADNRAGAAGVIGTELAAKAPPDGYTLLMGSAGPLAILPGVAERVPYDPVRDFAPITLVSSMPFVLVVHPSLAVKSVQDLVALARAKPGQLNYASPGSGATTHLAMELFKALAKVDIVHVPYKGVAPAMSDLLAGQVQLMSGDLSTLMPQIKAGKLRALALSGAKRSALAPELPTIAESGVAGYEASGWFGVLAPAATPRPLVSHLNSAIVKGISDTDARERLAALGGDVVGGTPGEFALRLREDLAKWRNLIKAIGLKAEPAG